VAAVGVNTILEALAACPQPSAAARLLAPLAGTHLRPNADTMREGVALAGALASASVEELAAVLAAAREVSLALADQLVNAAGGQDAILQRTFAEHPWLTELEVVEQDGQTVARARLLPAAGAPENDLDKDVRELALLLLRCVPAADRADVAAVLPGGRPMRVGDYTHATSGLLRRYAHGRASIAWNRARLRIATAMVADADATRRLDTGRRLLTEATSFLHELGTGWIRERLTREDRQRLVQLLQRLDHEVAQLRPPPAATTTPGVDDVDEQGQLETDDPLHTLLHGVVANVPGRLVDAEPHYPSLAAFVGGTLTGQLPKVEALDWRLLGLVHPPDALAALRRLLGDLHAILAELAWGDTPRESLVREAQGTSRRASLHAAAGLARRSATRRLPMAADLGQRIAASGLDARVVVREEPSDTAEAHVWPPHTLAILVNLDSLTEWQDAQARLAEVLTTLPVGEPPVTLVPVRAGRTVPLFAASYISQLWPAPDAIAEWGGRLPPPHPTPLADAVLQAHQALQTLSAVAELGRLRDIQPPVQAAAQAAANQFQQARRAVADLPSDPVVDEILAALDELAGRVQRELDAGAEGDDPGLAASIAAGLEEPNDDLTTLAGLSVVAHEWDIDPAGAQRLLST